MPALPIALAMNGYKQDNLNTPPFAKFTSGFNQPNTISLGYNTLGFDDEFLRYSFYRNLLDPYSHQYANGCKRMDLFPITTLYYLFKNKSLTPQIDGRISLKIEALNQANSLAKGRAHDAMVRCRDHLGLSQKTRSR